MDSCQQEALSATPGSSVLGICQARILEWVAISLQGNLLDPGIELKSAALAGRFFPTEPRTCHLNCCSRRASLLPNLPPPICLLQTTFAHGRALATIAVFFFFFFDASVYLQLLVLKTSDKMICPNKSFFHSLPEKAAAQINTVESSENRITFKT